MTELKKRIKGYWTHRAEGYSKVNQEELATEQRSKWKKVLKEHLAIGTSKLKVLDIGTGPGFFAILLAEMGCEVTGIDCTEAMLEEARTNALNAQVKVEWKVMDAEALEFEKEQFDCIITRNLTWVLPHPDKAYTEWLRVLKLGGILLNFDANWYHFLVDEKDREGYEQDRRLTSKLQVEDYYEGTDIEEMEAIARKVPLTKEIRPRWDEKILKKQNVAQIIVDENIWQKVWSETEKINSASSPMFMIKVRK